MIHSLQSAVRILKWSSSVGPSAVRGPHSQSAFLPRPCPGHPVRSPHSALAVRTRTEFRDGACSRVGSRYAFCSPDPPFNSTGDPRHNTAQLPNTNSGANQSERGCGRKHRTLMHTSARTYKSQTRLQLTPCVARDVLRAALMRPRKPATSNSTPDLDAPARCPAAFCAPLRLPAQTKRPGTLSTSGREREGRRRRCGATR